MDRREAMKMAGAVALGGAATTIQAALPEEKTSRTFYNFKYILRICPEGDHAVIYVQGSGEERVRESVEQVVDKIAREVLKTANSCFVELTPM